MKRLLLLACLALLACGQSDNWYVDMPNYRPTMILIAEVDDIYAACGLAAAHPVMCVKRLPSIAQIYVKRGLTNSEYECYMTHELIGHVIKGMNHDDRPNFAPNCGPKRV